MIPLALAEIGRVAPGELRPGSGDVVTGVTVDSRRVKAGDLFVAVGHGTEFADDALAAGAAAALLPEDAFTALGGIAREVRSRSQAKVVAITGSTA